MPRVTPCAPRPQRHHPHHQQQQQLVGGGVVVALLLGTCLPCLGSPALLEPAPTPTPWPSQFHAVLFQNRTGRLALVDLWYDFPGGRNLNLIRSQQGRTLFDVEWDNGTSFYFDRAAQECKTVHFPVGILTPSWLRGADYLGTEAVDGAFQCHVWTKASFILYYEDIKTGLPVKWVFLGSQAEFHVLSLEPGALAPEDLWQAPAFCFQDGKGSTNSHWTVREQFQSMVLPRVGPNLPLHES